MVASVTLGTGLGGCGVVDEGGRCGPVRKPFGGGGGSIFGRFNAGWCVDGIECVVGDLVAGLVQDLVAGLVCGLVRGLRLWGGLWWWAILRMALDTSFGNCWWMVAESVEICSSTLSSCCVWCWCSMEVRVDMQLRRPASQASLCSWDSWTHG